MTKKTTQNTDKPIYPGEELEGRYGWCGNEPKCLQFMNNPFGFLVMFTIILITQGLLVNGIFNVIITTLEQRFGFTSKEMGLVAVSYDIGYLVFTLFVTFYGNRGHRPRMMAVGSIFLGLGALLFALPHFTTDVYDYGDPTSSLCSDLKDDCSNDDPENLHAYLALFIIAMMIQGIGCIPFFTVSYAILEDSLPKNKSPVYISWANAMSILGPVLGYIIAGFWILPTYVDFHIPGAEPEGASIYDPRWVGAWYLGHLMAAIICFGVIAMPMFGFPRQFPGSAKIRSMRESEVHANAGAEIIKKANVGKSFRDIPSAIKLLLKNPTFIFTVAGGCSEAFIISGFTAFLPKVIENQYNTTPAEAAKYAGLIAIPGGVLGNLLAGIYVSRKKLKTPQLLNMAIFCVSVIFVLAPIGLYLCEDPVIIGVTASYSDLTQRPPETNINSECNEMCNCDGEYFNPVCAGNFSYFSPCHAGCLSYNFTSEEYLYCQCEDYSSLPRGLCEETCNAIIPFIIVFFIINVANFALTMPAQLVILRCVPDEFRSFAVGLQVFLMRIFGSIPGPLIFGAIFDTTCILWEEIPCDGGQGSCYLYDSWTLAVTLMALSMAFKALSGTLFFLAKRYYKPSKQEDSSQELNFTGNINSAFGEDIAGQDSKSTLTRL